MAALGYEPQNLQVILMQLVRLFSGGEMLRMSKRTGTYVTLAELMDDIGVDAARFFFVMRSADSQMDFDLDLATKQSADNPVFYVQYAHARICSIIRQCEEQRISLPDLAKIDFSLLKEASEYDLIRKMIDFPEEIADAAAKCEPNRIANYSLELAGLVPCVLCQLPRFRRRNRPVSCAFGFDYRRADLLAECFASDRCIDTGKNVRKAASRKG